ncbi:Restriction of telomere capping protein 5 [Purpureocillium lavendulum]|uniref:Restriction of telomere capping protein 5 n=1 Tax=Purpureocillium lavendulum TaxID=1247861 RepID=A0AB34FUG2_9HYPO|nr:Restriction of telomere capping protein 5 [Purpureocillium lavendulum]
MTSAGRMESLLRRGNVTLVPRDQQRLLESENAWAAKLKNPSDGLVNVPEHVIQSVEQAYIRAKHLGGLGEANSNGNEPASSPDTPPPRTHSIPEPSSTAVPQQDSSPVESLKSQVCQSPSRDAPRHSPPRASSPAGGGSPKQPARMAPPPLPVPRLEAFPAASDSSEEEDDLDVEVPFAGEQQDVRVNMAATHRLLTATPYQASPTEVTDTPPCAQPSHSIVPETILKEPGPQPPNGRHEARQHRHKLYMLTSSPIKPPTTAANSRRMATTKTFLGTADVSSSYSTSSGSVVPATLAASSMNSVIASVETGDAATGADGAEEAHDSDDDSDDAAGSPSQGILQMSGDAPASARADVSPPALQTSSPFAKFISTYPDYATHYRGSLWNFIRALICLEYLKSERLVKESGYDEFIRAFSHGYLEYVAKAGPGQEPLPAVEWFNMLPGRQIYTAMVVRAENLDAIIKAFPHEVARARRIIRGASEEPPPPPKRDSERFREEPKRLPSKTPELPLPEAQMISREDDTMDLDTPESRPARRRQPPQGSPAAPAPSEPPAPIASQASAVDSKTGAVPATPTTVSPTRVRAPRSSGYFARLEARVSKSRQRSFEEHKARVQKHVRRQGSSRRSSMSSGGRAKSTDKSKS